MTTDRPEPPERRRWTKPPFSVDCDKNGELVASVELPGLTDERRETTEARNVAWRVYTKTRDDTELRRLGLVANPYRKECSLCGEEKDGSEFYIDRSPDSLSRNCRPCDDEVYAQDLAVRQRESERSLLRAYGITMQQRDDLLESQGAVCSVCLTPEPPYGRWVTDHDHATKRIRGILCSPCNVQLVPAMERFRSEPELAERLTAYLAAEGTDPISLAWHAYENGDDRGLRSLGLGPLFDSPPE